MGSSVQEEGKVYPSHSQTPAGLFLVAIQVSIPSGDRRGPQNCLRQSWRLSCLQCRWPPRVGSRPAIQGVKVGRRGVVTPNRYCASPQMACSKKGEGVFSQALLLPAELH